MEKLVTQSKLKKINSTNSGKKKELVKTEEVKESPFTIVTTEEGSFGGMGKYRITEVYEKKAEVRAELKKMTWNRITQVVLLLIETQNNK